jgi:hypothetical protein
MRWALTHAEPGAAVEAVMAWEVPPSYGVGPTVSGVVVGAVLPVSRAIVDRAGCRVFLV